MTTPHSINENVERLQLLNVELRRQLELAEAQLPEINRLLHQLGSIGVGADQIIRGPVVYQQPYSDAGHDASCQVVQAVAIGGRGFGAVLWGLDEYIEAGRRPNLVAADIERLFVPFDELNLATKALLMPHVEQLLERICQQIVPTNFQQTT